MPNTFYYVFIYIQYFHLNVMIFSHLEMRLWYLRNNAYYLLLGSTVVLQHGDQEVPRKWNVNALLLMYAFPHNCTFNKTLIPITLMRRVENAKQIQPTEFWSTRFNVQMLVATPLRSSILGMANIILTHGSTGIRSQLGEACATLQVNLNSIVYSSTEPSSHTPANCGFHSNNRSKWVGIQYCCAANVKTGTEWVMWSMVWRGVCFEYV